MTLLEKYFSIRTKLTELSEVHTHTHDNSHNHQVKEKVENIFNIFIYFFGSFSSAFFSTTSFSYLYLINNNLFDVFFPENEYVYPLFPLILISFILGLFVFICFTLFLKHKCPSENSFKKFFYVSLFFPLTFSFFNIIPVFGFLTSLMFFVIGRSHFIKRKKTSSLTCFDKSKEWNLLKKEEIKVKNAILSDEKSIISLIHGNFEKKHSGFANDLISELSYCIKNKYDDTSILKLYLNNDKIQHNNILNE